MNDRFQGATSNAADTSPAPAPRLRWGGHFSPHILVFMLTILAAIPPLRGVIVSTVNLWWGKTYAKVYFVMDEARPNDGVPYFAGHLEGSTDQYNLPGVMQGSTIAVEGAPSEAFAPGKRVQIWHSEQAPRFGVFGEDTNGIAVAALPERPGWGRLLLSLVWLWATFVVGLRATAWVAKRWSRTFGTLPMDRRSRNRLGGL